MTEKEKLKTIKEIILEIRNDKQAMNELNKWFKDLMEEGK